MAEDKQPEETKTAPETEPGGGDLVGGLEALLEEEGRGLDLGDELADIFDDEDEDEAPGAVPQNRTASRRTRRERNQRDREEYRNLEAHLQSSPLGLQVSEDKMTVRVSRITADNTAEEIDGLLKSLGITAGIDHEAIRSALVRASSGQNQSEVTVARGQRPNVLEPTHIVHHLPRELITDIDATRTPFERLKRLLEGGFLEACKSWRGPVKFVRKGDVVAELVEADIEAGYDVYGQEVSLASRDGVELVAGENTTLSEDGSKCTSELYGYAGLIGQFPTVVSPIWMSPDHMEARFIFHTASSTPPLLTEEDLREILEMKWIEFGVLEKQLELIVRRLEERQSLPVTVPIAQGNPEIPGEDARIRYAFDPFELMKWNQLQSLLSLKAPQAIELALAEIYDGDAESGILFKVVKSGEVVAEKVPSTSGIAGTDIQGEEVTPHEGFDVPLEVGDGLVVDQDGLRASAELFGYVSLRWDIEVNVFSPLWVAPDRAAAYFLNLPQGQSRRYPSVEDMQTLVDHAGIVNGYSAERWAEVLAELEAGQKDDYLILVAQGTRPQRGSDAKFEWAVQIDSNKPGKILEDGSIDFRDRNLTTVAKEGDKLGKLIPPKPGVSGRDIFGNELRPRSSLSIEIVTDLRIYAEPEEDGLMAFFCEVGGGISTNSETRIVKGRAHNRINIGVYPISNIEGDIDYHTGNIDFNGDVVIGGSVQSQFSVKATGTVTIAGYVEAGAFVTAGKDLLVKRGVVGASTELVAGGDVMAKFIQEATVRAGGDIKVGSYIFNASVRAAGQIVVPGMGEGKSRALVGGLIWGAKGISALSIGSPYNTSTRLVVGVDPDQVNRADQIRANMLACQQKQQNLLKKIGVDSVDLNIIKRKLARCSSPKQRQTMLMAVKRIAKVAELEQNQETELKEIAESQRQLAHRTSINVLSELFAGVELRIGEQTELVREDAERVRFKLVTEDEEAKIQMDPLTGNVKMS